ncbi:MAG TPA: hypothetical protein VJA21_33000 [Verrucomicrobiae bacterium]
MTRPEWLLVQSGAGHYDFNMALDEALLESMPTLGRPTLRFYGWIEPAASFGYFQRYTEVENLTPLRPLVRRPTGGGIVPHKDDWTYSVAFPPAHEWYSVPAVESYRRVHQWIHDAFGLLGIPTELAPATRQTQPGQCFAGFERFDLLRQGRKIAGAAQRRRRDGLLIQGSVQPPGSVVARSSWERAMRRVAEEQWSIRWQDLQVEGPLCSRARDLTRAKYSQPAYNQRR